MKEPVFRFTLSLMLSFAFLLALLASVRAQEASSTSSSVKSGAGNVQQKIVYREKSYYDFEDTLIRGDRPLPDGSSVFRKDKVKFKSRLNLKRSFMPELKSSSQNVH